MSDVFDKGLLSAFQQRIKLAQPELSYAKGTSERRPLFCVEIPYPVLKIWHDYKCTNTTSDYIDLLEATIPGGLFVFSEEESVRREVNDSLAKISGFVAQLYRKTKGRNRQDLDHKVRKFHVFQGQNKEVDEFKAEIFKVKDELKFQSTTLQEEIDDWRSRYENLEQEKENLLNTMATTLREKDRIIGHLQTTNHELQQYINKLEMQFDFPKQYQGQTPSESKNKSRTIKNFLSRAEVGLWFSKSFGIEIESLHVNECDTGAKHLLHFSGSKGQTEATECVPEQEKSRYSSLDEYEKKQIQEILFLLDKFYVGDSFYHELSMLHKGLPRSYLIKQCRDDLNAICHIDRLPGSTVGAKVRSIEGLIVEHVKESLAQLDNFDLSKDKIQIKISGDGAKMTRNSILSCFLSLFFNLENQLCHPKEIEQLQCLMDMKTTKL